MDAQQARGVLKGVLGTIKDPFWQQPGVLQGLQAWALSLSSYGQIVVGGTELNSHNWGSVPCYSGAPSCTTEDRNDLKIALYGSDPDGIRAWVTALSASPALMKALGSGRTYELAEAASRAVFGEVAAASVIDITESLTGAANQIAFDLSEPLYWLGVPGPQDDTQALELLDAALTGELADRKTPTARQGLLGSALALTDYGVFDGQPTNNWGRIGTSSYDACPPDTLRYQGQCLKIYPTPSAGIAASLAATAARPSLRAAMAGGDTGVLAYELLMSGAFGNASLVTEGEWTEVARVLQSAMNRLASQPLGLSGFVWTTDVPSGLIPTQGGPEELAAHTPQPREPPAEEAGVAGAPGAATVEGPSGLKVAGIVAAMFAAGWAITYAVDKSGALNEPARR